MKKLTLILISLLINSCSYRCICLEKELLNDAKESFSELDDNEKEMYYFVKKLWKEPGKLEELSKSHKVELRKPIDEMPLICYDDQCTIFISLEDLQRLLFCKNDPVRGSKIDSRIDITTKEEYITQVISVAHAGRFNRYNAVNFYFLKYDNRNWELKSMILDFPYFTGWEKIDNRVQKHLVYDYDYFKIEQRR